MARRGYGYRAEEELAAQADEEAVQTDEQAMLMEEVAAQADILRESLSETDTVLQAFSFTVRDDFLSRLAETPEVRDVLQNVVVLRNLSGDALQI